MATAGSHGPHPGGRLSGQSCAGGLKEPCQDTRIWRPAFKTNDLPTRPCHTIKFDVPWPRHRYRLKSTRRRSKNLGVASQPNLYQADRTQSREREPLDLSEPSFSLLSCRVASTVLPAPTHSKVRSNLVALPVRVRTCTCMYRLSSSSSNQALKKWSSLFSKSSQSAFASYW